MLSSILSIDNFPSADYPVDFDGRRDENGMYRLPSVGDVNDWDSAHCSWGDVLRITGPSDPLYITISDGLTSVIGIGILRIHPQAFVNSDGNLIVRSWISLMLLLNI